MQSYTPLTRTFACSYSSVKTRIQADKNSSVEEHGKVQKKLGILETLIAIIKSKEGPAALYRGFVANMANSFIQRAFPSLTRRIRLLLLVHFGAHSVHPSRTAFG